MGHTYGDARPKTVIQQEAESAKGYHHLVGGQIDGTKPTGHDATHGESATLHAHLQGDGERLLVDVQQAGGAHHRLAEALAVCGIALAPEQQGHHDDGHYDACRECADTGAEQTKTRERAYTVDKHKVAHNVEHIAHEYDPHAGGGFGYAVGKLAQGIEQRHKQERGANG